jgi:hypothetical protein
MISKAIYFIDGWVRANVGAQSCVREAEALARRCIADAARAGFTNEQLETDLGTDLVDFLTSELKAREAARAAVKSRPAWGVRAEPA